MAIVDFNVRGNIVAALYLMSLPLILVLIGVYAVRRGRTSAGWRLNRRLRHAPLILALGLYFGVIYRQFFYDQFYWLVVTRTGEWQFEYYLPSRTATIDPADITDIRARSGDLWTYRGVRLVVETSDREQFVSTQVSRHDRDAFVAQVNALRREAGKGVP